MDSTTPRARRSRRIKEQIRDELRAAFPAASFEIIVRTDRGSKVFGNIRIAVIWEGGPSEAAVAAITDKYVSGDVRMADLCRSDWPDDLPVAGVRP